MDRRTFLARLTATGAAASLSGCAAVNRFLDGGGNSEDSGQIVDGTSTPTESGESFRVDFVDETDTLGHVAENYSTDASYDDAVNTFDQETWQMMDENDIDEGNEGDGVWSEGDVADHIGEIQPFVEYTLGMRDNLPNHDPQEITGSWGNINGERTAPITIQQVRESDKNWAEKLAWGTGFGVDKILPKVDSGAESAQTVLPAIEYFNKELLEDEKNVDTYIASTKEPETPYDKAMSHLSGVMTYTEGGSDLTVQHIEPTLGGGLPPSFNHAIGDPEDSIYAQEGVENAASPLEYSKALRLSREGKINTDEDFFSPEHGMSGAVTATLWSWVDAATMGLEDDFQDGEEPHLVDNPNEIRNAFNGAMRPNYVTPDFGRSVEQKFDNYDREVEQQFENIGRGIETFYQEFGVGTPMAIGGTVDEPEFYNLTIKDMQNVLRMAPDDLSQYQ